MTIYKNTSFQLLQAYSGQLRNLIGDFQSLKQPLEYHFEGYSGIDDNDLRKMNIESLTVELGDLQTKREEFISLSKSLCKESDFEELPICYSVWNAHEALEVYDPEFFDYAGHIKTLDHLKETSAIVSGFILHELNKSQQPESAGTTQTKDHIVIEEKQIRVLKYLAEKPKLKQYQTDIEIGTNISRNTVSKILSELDKSGFVKKHKRGCCITQSGLDYIS